MVEMLVPMLVLRLDKEPSNLGSSKTPSPQLLMHSDALQRLIQIGPQFPVAFKVSNFNTTWFSLLNFYLQLNHNFFPMLHIFS